jgi:hypothetical protein
VSGIEAATPEWVWVPKAADIAREAGARLREFFTQGVKTEYKGGVDLVTVADRTSEKLIRCCGEANAGVEKAVAMDRYRRYSERWYAQDLRRTPAQRHKGQRLEQLSTQFGVGGAADQFRDAGRFVQVHLDSDQLTVSQDEVPVLGKQSSVPFGTSILEQCIN